MRGLAEQQAFLERRKGQLSAAAEEMAAADSMLIVSEVMRNFSGSHPPGVGHSGGSLPNIVSGDLRRSNRPDPVQHVAEGVVRTSVAPRMAYGRRVELGFEGADALGRVFSQPAYPFFRPGVVSAIPLIRSKNREIFTAHMG